MEAKLQKRVQRYGWDLAAPDYEGLWQAQLECAQSKLLECVSIAPGERVVDIACGTGLVTFRAAEAAGVTGYVVGTDISGEMVDTARRRARRGRLSNVGFMRMDAENVTFVDASFDVALCALGLMYVPDPLSALMEMRRVVRPGGRVGVAVWGDRLRCGWSPVFPITEAEVKSDVCPLFFNLGQADNLIRLFHEAKVPPTTHHRIDATLVYADGDEACDAAFVGGPVALAWSRFDRATRARVRARYLKAISQWRNGDGYRIPGEFVLVTGSVPP
jgi:SAM-dependent methyltransferase